MITSTETRKGIILFYILLIYVILQFVWWSYLLIDLNFNIESLLNGVNTDHFEGFSAKRKMWMVVGEGVVFILIISLGATYILRSLDREGRQREREKNFMLSITHELKTPLSTIRLYMETLLKRNLEHEKQKDIFRKSIAETDRLKFLIDKIVTSAGIGVKKPELFLEETNLGNALKKIFESRFSDEQKARIIFNCPDNCLVNTDEMLLTTVIINLVENGLKYSPIETQITLEIFKEKEFLNILVKDQGIEIPDSERENIFERFYRIGNEETRKTKGTGLGLFIVKTFVGYLKGRIKIKSNQPKGSIFVVQLPLHDEEK